MPPTALPDEVRHAWVDESMIQRPDRAGFYCLAAITADPTGCDPIRDQFRGLRQRASSKLHWREEQPHRLRAITSTVATLTVPATVVVVARLDRHRQERARRFAMEALLPHLADTGVTQVWLEARTTSLNRHDLATVEFLRGSRRLAPHLRVDTAQPSVEPMLWLADILAGATMAAQLGQPRYLAQLAHLVTPIDITAR